MSISPTPLMVTAGGLPDLVCGEWGVGLLAWVCDRDEDLNFFFTSVQIDQLDWPFGKLSRYFDDTSKG